MMRASHLLSGAAVIGLACLAHSNALATPGFPLSVVAVQASASEQMSPEDVVQTIRDFRPPFTDLATGKDGAIDDSKRQLAEFRELMDRVLTPEMIAQANNPQARGYRRSLRRAEVWADQTQSRILEANIARAEQEGYGNGLMAQYVSLLFAGEGLKQLARLYPDSPVIQEAASSTTDRVAQLGSFTQVENRIAAAAEARAARVRMLPARQNNPSLANQFRRAFSASAYINQTFPGAQIAKLHLIETGWTFERHPVTGIIVSRYQRGQFAVRTPDGKCHSYLGLFEQRSNGSGYGPLILRSGQAEEMACENI